MVITSLNPVCFIKLIKSVFTYSRNHGSVLLNAAKANGFEANLIKAEEVGFISINEKAPPGGRIRYASSNKDLVT